MPVTAERRPLDRLRVVDAAIALADDQGLADVSMRAVASRLEVVPMALYKHVSDKDDLVAAMIDRVVAGFASPPAGTGGEEIVRLRIENARDAIRRHPWLRGAIESAPAPTPAVLGHMEAIAAAFTADGYSLDLTHHAMHALGSRIWGFTPEAFDAPAVAGDADPQAVAQFVQTFPTIAGIAGDAAARHGGCDRPSEFDFTLDLLLDAFRRLRDAGWSSSDLPARVALPATDAER